MQRVIDPHGVEMAAIDELIDVDGLRVLEIGCGDGRLTFRYAPRAAFVLGLDPETESVRAARDATPAALADKVRFRTADASRMRVPRRKFDLALYAWSL